ncbi:MAG: hypothetical protein K9H49_04595 [Bacteroidales bacterium]|nr:hypothetical protein [Bacteroidales bacterium]MCF8389094.1 hypothetical protein [Bacteroidales bacterium]
MKKVYILLTNIFFLSLLSLSGQDFEVAPVLINFDANPGESQSKILTIRNHNPERQKFILSLSDYEPSPDGGKSQMEAGSSSRTLFNWININPSLVELNPNESAEVELIMNVPRDGYNTRWGMIRVQLAKEQVPSAADKQLATGVIIVPRIVVLVNQSPRANQNYKASIKDLIDITKPDDELRHYEAVIVNLGDKVINAKIFLALANLETASEEQFTPQTVSVYPGFERKVSLTLPRKIEPGTYALAFLMDYGNNTAIEGSQILLEVE